MSFYKYSFWSKLGQPEKRIFRYSGYSKRNSETARVMHSDSYNFLIITNVSSARAFGLAQENK